MASVSGEISSDKLTDLRVVDLRNELEKRGLDKTGVKAVLLQRLEKALKCEEEESRKNTEESEEKPDVAALVKIDTHSEEKCLEENQSTEDIKNEHTTDNMDEKESETANVALTDVLLNTTNSNGYSLLSDKTSVEDLSEDQLLSSDTKPSDMLADNTFDKDQFKEELPISSSDTNKDTGTVLQGQSDDPLKNTTAPPEQSSSSTENNIKEENSEKSSSARMRIATLPLNSNELKDEVVIASFSDSLPPTPTSVPCIAPLTLEDTINMDTSIARKSEENESLILHVDDTQNDLDADIVASKTNNKTDNASMDKVSGKTEVKKTDGSKVEERAKGKPEGGQTEKKADEKKDDKDVKSKSSLVSKPKAAKKGNNQANRNLWVSGFPANVSDKFLTAIFSKYGKVADCQMITRSRKSGTRCHAFVTMSTEAEALQCIMWLNKSHVNGMKLTVERKMKISNKLQEKRQKTARWRKKGPKAQEKRRSQNLGLALKLQKDVEKQQQEEAIRLDIMREQLRLEKMKLEKEKLLKYRMEKEILKMERRSVEMRCAEMLRLEEMTHSVQRPPDRKNPRKGELWDEPKRRRMMNSRNLPRFEPPFQNESRFEQLEEPDYGRQMDRFERREGRETGGRFNEYKEREMMRREMDLFRDFRGSGERRPDDQFLTDDHLNRMPNEFRRDMGPSGELDRRFNGPDRGRDIDRQIIPAHNRSGRMRTSGGGPEQRPSWGSGSVDRKAENWSHMHGNMNSDMIRPNDRCLGNPMNTTGRDATGAFVASSSSGGMGQKQRPGNMFGSSQPQGGMMMMNTHGGSNNMGGRVQQPRFNVYNIMGSM
ncbi:scaffold attachment factor B1 isoform X2 [Octopus vulgaris]|uniref:Scaffold attachment factor B1 isoform X2 n=1 Tax=Octopus vulgaris TaxID=6645 RepID=A0AA36FFA9_OCTVU|nr:scaffold attachment factor B1 isoform X2 [Octopus vulgaris]